MKPSHIQIFFGDQLERSQMKQVVKSHILRRKENLNKAFPKQEAIVHDL